MQGGLVFGSKLLAQTQPLPNKPQSAALDQNNCELLPRGATTSDGVRRDGSGNTRTVPAGGAPAGVLSAATWDAAQMVAERQRLEYDTLSQELARLDFALEPQASFSFGSAGRGSGGLKRRPRATAWQQSPAGRRAEAPPPFPNASRDGSAAHAVRKQPPTSPLGQGASPVFQKVHPSLRRGHNATASNNRALPRSASHATLGDMNGRKYKGGSAFQPPSALRLDSSLRRPGGGGPHTLPTLRTGARDSQSEGGGGYRVGFDLDGPSTASSSSGERYIHGGERDTDFLDPGGHRAGYGSSVASADYQASDEFGGLTPASRTRHDRHNYSSSRSGNQSRVGTAQGAPTPVAAASASMHQLLDPPLLQLQIPAQPGDNTLRMSPLDSSNHRRGHARSAQASHQPSPLSVAVRHYPQGPSSSSQSSSPSAGRSSPVDAVFQQEFSEQAPLLPPVSSLPMDTLDGDLPVFELPVVRPATPPPLAQDLTLLPPQERKAAEALAAAKAREQQVRDQEEAAAAAKEQERLALLDHLLAGGGVRGQATRGSSSKNSTVRRGRKSMHAAGAGASPLHRATARPLVDPFSHRRLGSTGDGSSSSNVGGGVGHDWASERGESIEWLRSALAASEAVSGAIAAQTQDTVCGLKGVVGLPLPTSDRARRMLYAKGLDRLTRCVSQQGVMRVLRAWQVWRQCVKAYASEARRAAFADGLSRQRLTRILRTCLDRLIVQGWAKWWAVAESLKRAETWQEEDAAARMLQNVWRGRLARTAVAQVKATAKRKLQHHCCLRLQAVLRGKLARKRVLRYLSAEHREDGAEIIQRAWRCYWARKRTRLNRAQLLAATSLQRLFRGARGRRRFEVLERKAMFHAAASSLQRMFRGGNSRRKFLWVLRRLRRQNGALFIQRCYGGMRGRWVAYKHGAMRQRGRDKRHAMATRIQRRWRQRSAQLLQAGEAEDSAAKARREVRCTVMAQAAARRGRCGRSVRKLLKKRWQRRLTASRACVETWSEANSGWVFVDTKTGAEYPEPPETGYTKQSGLLVLETGEVVGPQGQPMAKPGKKNKKTSSKSEDAHAENAESATKEKVVFLAWTESPEEEAARLLKHRIKCVEFPLLPATRWDAVWDEPFSEPGWALAHGTEYPSTAVYAVAMAEARRALEEPKKEGMDNEEEAEEKEDEAKREMEKKGGETSNVENDGVKKKKKKVVVKKLPAATLEHIKAAEAVLAKAEPGIRKSRRPRHHAFCRIDDEGKIALNAEDADGTELGPYAPDSGGRGLLEQQAKAALADPNWQSYGLTVAGGGHEEVEEGAWWESAWSEQWDEEQEVPYW